MKSEAAIWPAAQAIVYSHAAVTAIHGAAHARLQVELTTWEKTFVAVVIVAAPLAALAIWKAGRRASGGALLAVAMSASLIFGVWNHFLILGADHVGHLPGGAWRPIFQVTAGLLAATEAAGCAVGWRMLKDTIRS
jgi:hypothetical protein